MKAAIIGSRGLSVHDMGKYLPEGITGIISGGAKGIDSCAREYALSHGIPITEFLPDYKRYGKSAPLKRNILIIQKSDILIAFWDGRSLGTKFVIDNCKKLGKPLTVYIPVSPCSTQEFISYRPVPLSEV